MPPLKAHGPLGLCLPSSFSHDSPTFRESRIWASCLGSRGREPHSFQVRMPWTLIHKSFVVVHSALWSFWLFWCLHMYIYIYVYIYVYTPYIPYIQSAPTRRSLTPSIMETLPLTTRVLAAPTVHELGAQLLLFRKHCKASLGRALGHFMFSLIGLKRINNIFQRL